MSDVTSRRRIAALVVMAFLLVMGAAVAAATIAEDAQAGGIQEEGVAFSPDGKLLAFIPPDVLRP